VIALIFDQSLLADPLIGLAQRHTLELGQLHQSLARPLHQFGIGRETDRLFLHRGVDNHRLEVGRLGSLHTHRRGQAFLHQGDELVLAHALAPARQGGPIKGQSVLEELFTAEQLVIRVLHPAFAQHFIRQVVHVLEDRQSRHQPRRQGWAARLVVINRPQLLFQKTPVDRLRQLHQGVLQIGDLIKPRPEQVPLATVTPFLGTHPNPRSFCRKSPQTRGETCKILYFNASYNQAISMG